MITTKKLGIWMDHSNAHLIEFTNEVNANANKVIVSKFTHEAKEQSLGKSENLMHNKERHQQSEFYKELGEVIHNYEAVILFGPTNAKNELINILRADHRFEKIKIDTQQSDKLTDGQQQAFVRDYFSKNQS